MIRYIIRRVLYAIPTLLGVIFLTFFLFYVSVNPQTMARRQLGKNPTPGQVQNWLREHGYDKPTLVQFGNYLTKLSPFKTAEITDENGRTRTVPVLLPDFGRSDVSSERIWDKIEQGAPVSFQLGLLLLMGSLLASLTFSLIVAYYRGTYIDNAGTFLSVLLMSIVYLVYIMGMQYLFGRILKYAPIAGWQGGLKAYQFLFLPVLIGVVQGLGSSVRFYRTVMLDEINTDYVRTARAKGIPEGAILFKHVLKNAALPILTNTVSAIPQLILGSLLLESFFGIPGMGGVLFDAIQSLDFAMVRAMVYLGAVLYIVGLIMTDISYALFDPRVRLE